MLLHGSGEDKKTIPGWVSSPLTKSVDSRPRSRFLFNLRKKLMKFPNMKHYGTGSDSQKITGGVDWEFLTYWGSAREQLKGLTDVDVYHTETVFR
jgi:hypothetical protein